MSRSKPLALVLNYKPHTTYAFNVLVGAVETAPDLQQEVEVLFCSKADRLTSTVREARQRYPKVVVAWSFYSPGFLESVQELVRVNGELKDEVIHVVGGVHATAEPHQTATAGFDLVAVGEGEQTLVDLLRQILAEKDYFSQKGLAYVREGRFSFNGSSGQVDINRYPPFAALHRRFNPIEITRGCIYACGFCQTPFMFKARFRHRSVENICHYVEVMKSVGLSDVRFITPTSLSYGSPDESVNLAKVEELLSSVRRVLGNQGRIFFGTFPSEVRPEHCTKEALTVLKRYVANDNLIIGGQSGSDRILKATHRGHGVEDIASSVQNALAVGFVPNVDFIFGLPGETSQDVQSTLRLADRLADMGARIHGHTFMPLPGTPFRNAAPGRISRAALQKLDRLISRGKLYGQWKQQVSVARSLASTRTPARGVSSREERT